LIFAIYNQVAVGTCIWVGFSFTVAFVTAFEQFFLRVVFALGLTAFLALRRLVASCADFAIRVFGISHITALSALGVGCCRACFSHLAANHICTLFALEFSPGLVLKAVMRFTFEFNPVVLRVFGEIIKSLMRAAAEYH